MITKEMIFNMPKNMLKNELCPNFSRNGVTLYYYGGDLCDITIEEDNLIVHIYELFDIPEPVGLSDELCYRITDEAIEFVLDRINK